MRYIYKGHDPLGCMLSERDVDPFQNFLWLGVLNYMLGSFNKKKNIITIRK